MYKQIFGCLVLIALCPSCSNNAPNISVVCEENPRTGKGDCVIKWETTPVIEGKVKIYASTDPDKIPEKNPILTVDISAQLVSVAVDDPTQRQYYKLVFDNKYSVVTASRNVVISGIQNFRDIGGYPASNDKEVRWGMVYRSSHIEDLSYATFKELKNIGIKTIIDFRTPEELAKTQQLEGQGFNVVHLPISIFNTCRILDDLREDRIENDSVYNLMLNANRNIVTYYRNEYKKMFEILKEKENYPVLILCSTGMGRTSIASALILSVLGVNDDVIMSDYLKGNRYLDIPRASGFGYDLPVGTQEAITTLYSAREDFLNAAKTQIEKNYGNISTYLNKGLGLDNDNIKEMRHFLLH